MTPEEQAQDDRAFRISGWAFVVVFVAGIALTGILAANVVVALTGGLVTGWLAWFVAEIVYERHRA